MLLLRSKQIVKNKIIKIKPFRESPRWGLFFYTFFAQLTQLNQPNQLKQRRNRDTKKVCYDGFRLRGNEA